MVNIPVWKIMPSCGVVIVKVTQRNYQNGFDVVFRLYGRWTLWRLFSDVFLSCTQSIFWKLWLKKRTHNCKLLGLVFSGKKVDICVDEDMKGSSACYSAVSLVVVCFVWSYSVDCCLSLHSSGNCVESVTQGQLSQSHFDSIMAHLIKFRL